MLKSLRVFKSQSKKLAVAGVTFLSAGSMLVAHGQSQEELEQRISELEDELAQAREQLQAEEGAEEAADKIQFGPLTIGGAMRVNYTFGDYDPELSRPSRAEEDGGVFTLDTFRINLDYSQGPWLGKVEYRFYPGYGVNNHDGYHFLHTGWVGYNFDQGGQLQVGVNRVPFGPGPYGISQSWLFDQHYYVGLSDDMDLGVKYTLPVDDWTFDFAYYYSDEGSWFGENFSNDSVRYSYDVVDESGEGYVERNQFNLRAIYNLDVNEDFDIDLGTSMQYGELKSRGEQSTGKNYAGSVHAVASLGNWTLAPQLTYYRYNVSDKQPLGTDELVQFGAYDFPTLVAAKAWIPAVSLSYYLETPGINWLDYMIPYAEYSSIMKTDDGLNNSDMFVLGSAWARGNWYIYTDLAFSNGNDFVGNEGGYGASPAPGFSSNRFGSNPNDDWQYRFNINFGYYF